MTGYADKPIPLKSYAALATAFNVALAAGLVAMKDDLPERFSPFDLVLLGVATHKYSRILAKDRVTSFLRAPFVRYEGRPARARSRSPRAVRARSARSAS